MGSERPGSRHMRTLTGANGWRALETLLEPGDVLVLRYDRGADCLPKIVEILDGAPFNHVALYLDGRDDGATTPHAVVDGVGGGRTVVRHSDLSAMFANPTLMVVRVRRPVHPLDFAALNRRIGDIEQAPLTYAFLDLMLAPHWATLRLLQMGGLEALLGLPHRATLVAALQGTIAVAGALQLEDTQGRTCAGLVYDLLEAGGLQIELEPPAAEALARVASDLLAHAMDPVWLERVVDRVAEFRGVFGQPDGQARLLAELRDLCPGDVDPELLLATLVFTTGFVAEWIDGLARADLQGLVSRLAHVVAAYLHAGQHPLPPPDAVHIVGPRDFVVTGSLTDPNGVPTEWRRT